jgi:hypothetical protein
MTALTRRLRGWRTVIVAALLGLAPLWDVAKEVLPVLATDPNLPRIIPEAWMPTYSLAVTLVMIWMRLVTTTPPGRRE